MKITSLFASIFGSRPMVTKASGEIAPYTGDFDFAIYLAAILIAAFVAFIVVSKIKTR